MLSDWGTVCMDIKRASGACETAGRWTEALSILEECLEDSSQLNDCWNWNVAPVKDFHAFLLRCSLCLYQRNVPWVDLAVTKEHQHEQLVWNLDLKHMLFTVHCPPTNFRGRCSCSLTWCPLVHWSLRVAKATICILPNPATISSQCLWALGRFTVAASSRSSAPRLILGGNAVASTLVIAYDKSELIVQ